MHWAEFRRTRSRIQPYLRATPVVPSETANLFLKLENLQHTHSFKVRGAFARVIDLIDKNEQRGILTVSTGYHGLAIARAASTFKLPCTVVVSTSTPAVVIREMQSYGADVRQSGVNYQEAEAAALILAKKTDDYVFISPYADFCVMLAQGTIGLEILEQVPNVATVIVPFGPSGLAVGVGIAIKQFASHVRVIGVCSEAASVFYNSKGSVRTGPSDQLGAATDPIDAEFLNPLDKTYLDDLVVVSEESIESAIFNLAFQEKLLIERGAATTIAAIAERKILVEQVTVAILSAATIDLDALNFRFDMTPKFKV